jgi:hypothetical protein
MVLVLVLLACIGLLMIVTNRPFWAAMGTLVLLGVLVLAADPMGIGAAILARI